LNEQDVNVRTNSTGFKNSFRGKFVLFVIWTHLFLILSIARFRGTWKVRWRPTKLSYTNEVFLYLKEIYKLFETIINMASRKGDILRY